MSRRVLLVDNGSLEPASTRQLRRLAEELEKRVGERVDPASLAHTDKVPAEELDGRRAELFEAALDRALREGVSGIVVVPLFVGPSHAITRWVPAMIEERREKFAAARIGLASPLFVPGEKRLGEILTEHVREQIGAGERPRVAIVDHGSPARAVTGVREAVAAQVRELLGGAVSEVAACSMERREGAEFDFNEPLLENLLARTEWRSGPLVVGLVFVAPGKHAGPDGDVAKIVRAARGGEMCGVKFTRVLGEHPRLVEILADRVRSVG